MTTIAYKDGVIAYDSRTTRGGLIQSDNKDKSITKGDVRMFFCGVFSDGDELMSAYLGESDKTFDESHAIVVDNGNIYHFCVTKEDGVSKYPIDAGEYFAIGSGTDHAYTAMDLGLSAKEAVKMAAKRDTGTGGRIRVYKI